MFAILFQWRKVSKCKKLIKKARCRLKLLKNKRSSIIRRLRSDLAQLLLLGYRKIAFERVEEVIRNEEIVTLYDLLDQFCEFILLQRSYIWKNKDCPNDISEAVSSIIYASARCGELPELRSIRTLFSEHYGQRFSLSALELRPGNLVNSQVKEKLSSNQIPDEMKFRLLNEIAVENHCQTTPLMLEYFDVEEEMNTEKDQLLKRQSRIEISNSSLDSSIINESPVHIVYLDDIEEIESPVIGGKILHDQRGFRFRSLEEDDVFNVEVAESTESGMELLDLVENSSTSCGKSRKIEKKSASRSLKDVEYASYYSSPSSKSSIRNAKSHPRTKKMTNNPVEHSEAIRYLEYCLLVLKYWKYLPHNTDFYEMVQSERSAMSAFKSSFSSSSSPGHVHPKLPDCDELEAKFRALKRDYLLKNH